jgi:hypothetical protein
LKTTLEVAVIVAENDVEGAAGARTCAAITKEGYRWPLRLVIARERGISHARNALMNAAFEGGDAAALAMIDDDQWVEPEWLDALMEMQQTTGADVVGGYTRPDFGGCEEPWTHALSVYWRPRRADGPCAPTFGAGGVLMSRSVLTYCRPPYFDPEFSITGGEDAEFFTRLAKSRATFAFAASAVAHEVIGSARATKGWARRRAYRIGTSDMRIAMLHPTCWTAAKAVLTIAAALVAGPVHFAVFFAVPHKRMAAELKLHRAFGKIAAFLGHRCYEYANTHGA